MMKQVAITEAMFTADFSCVEKSCVACSSRKIVRDYYRLTECELAASACESERTRTICVRQLYFRTVSAKGTQHGISQCN